MTTIRQASSSDEQVRAEIRKGGDRHADPRRLTRKRLPVYLVALGAWKSLAENYKGVETVDVQSEDYGDAHVLYDVGVGAAHMAGFANAAFVGATATALLTSATPWRRLGGIGVGLTVVWLINAPLQIFATADWSDGVGAIVFLSLLAWAFALSSVLVISLRRAAGGDPANSGRSIARRT